MKALANFRIIGHNMKYIYVLIVLLLFSLRVFATAQFGDILIWKGDTLVLFSNPLKLKTDYNSLIVQEHN